MKSHETASDWWNKGMGNNCVPITVGLENLMNEDQVKHHRLRNELPAIFTDRTCDRTDGTTSNPIFRITFAVIPLAVSN